MTCPQGSQAKLIIADGDSPYKWEVAEGGVPLEFMHEDVKLVGSIGVPDGIRGTRSEPSERARRGPYKIGGPFTITPSPYDMRNLLKYVLGSGPSESDEFELTEGLPSFGVLFDKVTETFGYYGAMVNRFILRGESGGGEPGAPPLFLTAAIEIFCKDRETNITFPEDWILPDAASITPYTFDDCTLTIGGTEHRPLAWTLLIHNFVRERRTNTLKPHALCPGRRLVAFNAEFPFDSTALLDVPVEGVGGSLQLSNSGGTTTFTFGRLQAAPRDPTVPGKVELTKQFNAISRSYDTTPELSVTSTVAP